MLLLLIVACQIEKWSDSGFEHMRDIIHSFYPEFTSLEMQVLLAIDLNEPSQMSCHFPNGISIR